ncbi:MAG: serine/threonine-protein kinase [Myxococcota bacterium]
MPNVPVCPACGFDRTAVAHPDAPLNEKYHIGPSLGEGGMGVVHEAVDRAEGRSVAIKFLRRQNSTSLRRLRREATALMRVAHPNIVRLIECCIDHRSFEPYLVMERLQGRPLSVLLQEDRPLEVERAVLILRQVLDALAAAHAHAIIHRDLTPSNVVVDPDDDHRVKVCDFGIAKVLDDTALTGAGIVVGTLGHMAPEQIRGEAVDARTDLYAVGVLLYRMLTGRLPYNSSNRAVVLYRQAHFPPPPPSDIVPALPGPVVELCLEAMSLDPSMRPRSALIMRDKLLAAIGAPA